MLANRFVDGYPYLCRTTDISRLGMRLHRLHEPAANPRFVSGFVGLQFQLPGSGEILTAAGEVVRSDEASREVSLRFTQLPAQTAAAIASFVDHADASDGAGTGER